MWWWVLIWAVLVLCALVYLGARLWTLWGQLKELGSELVPAQERLEAVQGQLDQLGERIAAPSSSPSSPTGRQPARARAHPRRSCCGSDARAGSARTPHGSGT